MLNQREIILAGGAGGLGSACAKLLALDNARLTVTYHRNAERALQLRDIASVVPCDITKAEDRTRLLDQAPNLYALIVFTGDPSRMKTPADFESVARHAQEVNYLGPIALARQAAARMQAQKQEGAIVLFSTMQAVALFPGSTAYAASKASLQHSARILAKELRASNIRVNCIAPGPIAAGMAEASIASGKYDYLIKDGIVPRFGRPEDIARAVRFLLTPDSYITGQILSVDGGITL